MASRKTILLGAAALAGCGDIIGLDGYSQGDGASPADVTVDTGGGDAHPDVKVSDAGKDVVNDVGNDVIIGTCTGTNVCVPPLPGGWTWTVYSADSRSPCGLGYGTPTDVEEGIDAGAPSCSCSCTVTGATCTGSLTVNSGDGTCTSNTQTDTAATGCQTLGTNIPDFGATSPMIAVTAPKPSGGSCTTVSDASVPPLGYGHQGRTCVPTATPDAGCGGGVCVPNPAPFTACVAQTGNNPCPSGFPTQHFIGTTVTDTRGCSGSGCGCTLSIDAGATCGGSITFYRNSCTSGTLSTINADGTCQSVGMHNWTNYQYTPSTTSASCAPTGTSSADGGAVFSDLTTVCCP